MTIRPVRAELFHAQRQIGWQTDMIKPVAFRNSAGAPTKLFPVPLFFPPEHRPHMVRPGMEQQTPQTKAQTAPKKAEYFSD
jgi:hypothetical protein